MPDREEGKLQEISWSSNTVPARSWQHSVWFIVLVAFLLRLAVITVGHTYRITPRRDHFQFGWEMGRIARSIATGHGFDSPTDLPSGPTAWAPPVYPYILAGVFKLFGVYSALSAWMILAFNSIFSALTCFTLYEIALSSFGVSVARATAWTWALFPYAIYWPTRVVWEMSLTAFLLSLALLLTIRMRKSIISRDQWIFYGLLWGVIALTNTTVLALLPFFVPWLLYWRREQVPWAGLTLCLAFVILVMTPWLVRNYVVFGKLILVRDNLPLEMQIANNNASTGLWTRSEHPGNDPEAMQRFQELGEIHFMDEKREEVRQFIRENPGRFVIFTLKRAMYFWIGTPQAVVVNGYDLIFFRHTTFLLGALLALGGLLLTVRNRQCGAFLFTCCLLIYPLPYYLVNPFPRYKHVIEPEMALLIVYLCWEASQRRVRWRN